MKIKHIVAAALAVASAAPALAAIDNTLANNVAGITGSSELFLVVYGTGLAGQSDASYTLDLGVLEKSFLSSPSLSVSLGGANWASFTSTIDLSTAKWAVMGGDNTGTASGSRNLLTTVQVGSEAAAATLTNDKLTNSNGEIDAFLSNVNQTGTHATQTNGDSFNKKGGLDYFLALDGNVLNNMLTFDNSNAIGTSSAFANLVRTSGTDNPVSQQLLAGVMNFKQVSGAYTLSYDVAQAVPEPSGIALAMTGLGVLGFVARRRRAD